jgi:hypothetical protein
LGSSSSFSIGHTENIIGLYSSVDSTVAWDGISISRSRIFGFLYTVEYFQGIFLTLGWLSLSESLILAHVEEGLFVLFKLLLLDNLISLLGVDAKEFINSIRGNRLLQVEMKNK